MSPIEIPTPTENFSPVPPAQNTPVSRDMTLAEILGSCESSMPISIQSAYAGTQLAQAKLCKEQSQKKLDEMRTIQERQVKITDLISKFRNEKAKGGGMSEETFNEMKRLGLSTEPNALESGWREIPPGPEMDKLIDQMQKAWERSKPGSTERKWLDDWLPSITRARSEGKPFVLNSENTRNLAAAMDKCGTRTYFNKAVDIKGEMKIAPQDDKKWEFNLKSMTNYQEQVGTNTQRTMVMLQDFIGQFNSYLQGANTAIDRANQLLAKLASGQQ